MAATDIGTARDYTYIRDNSDAGEEFILIASRTGGSGTAVTANPSGTDGDDLTRIAIGGTNYNIAGRISWAFVIDTLIVPELNQDAITDARIILEDSGLTHYLTFLDWTAASLDMIDHLPVGAHIGLRQGATTRILEVEAEWDSTNARYQVININTGILSESASGTATELLLTAGGGAVRAAMQLQHRRISSARWWDRDIANLQDIDFDDRHGSGHARQRGGYGGTVYIDEKRSRLALQLRCELALADPDATGADASLRQPPSA